mgnify:CR=1 FL=1
MKKSSTPSSSSTTSPDNLLTEGDLRGLAAAKKLADKLKEKYAPGTDFPDMPVHVSVMAGPVKKRE